MSFEFLISALSVVTLGIVIALAMWSKKRTEDRMDDPSAPKSSLATDGPGPQPIR